MKAKYANKVGQLTIQFDWLKKFEEMLGSDCESKFSPKPFDTNEIPVLVGAKLLGVNQTSIYYKSSPVSEEELACKEIIDHLHTDNPTWGARKMLAQLKAHGYHLGTARQDAT